MTRADALAAERARVVDLEAQVGALAEALDALLVCLHCRRNDIFSYCAHRREARAVLASVKESGDE